MDRNTQEIRPLFVLRPDVTSADMLDYAAALIEKIQYLSEIGFKVEGGLGNFCEKTQNSIMGAIGNAAEQLAAINERLADYEQEGGNG